MTTLPELKHEGGFGCPPQGLSQQKIRNKGGFPSPSILSQPQFKVTQTKSLDQHPRHRGGFPLPPKHFPYKKAEERDATREKPQGGFGLPPDEVKSLEELSKNVTIKELKGNTAGRAFARLSQQVSGYSYAIPEGGSALFAFCPGRPEPVGVVIFTIAVKTSAQNTLDFQFIHRQYQRLGIGTKLVIRAMELMAEDNEKEVYLEAAKQSRSFYMKLGFTECGDVVNTRGPGSAIFHHMYPMTRQLTDYVVWA